MSESKKGMIVLILVSLTMLGLGTLMGSSLQSAEIGVLQNVIRTREDYIDAQQNVIIILLNEFSRNQRSNGFMEI